jgi:hypothetical protein
VDIQECLVCAVNNCAPKHLKGNYQGFANPVGNRLTKMQAVDNAAQAQGRNVLQTKE